MSGPDPDLVYRELTSGDAGRLVAASESIRTAMGSLDQAASGIGSGVRTATSGWRGSAAGAFYLQAHESRNAVGDEYRRLGKVAEVVRGAAKDYRSMRDSADADIQPWRSREAGGDDEALRARVSFALGVTRSVYEHKLANRASSLSGGLFAPLDLLRPMLGGGAPEGSADGPPIPNTLLSDDPNPTWIPQGMAYRPEQDQLLVAYYGRDDHRDGLLSLIDENTGAEVNNVRLGGVVNDEVCTLPPEHNGGVAVDGDNVWVTSTDSDDGKSYVYRYSMAEIDAASKGEPVSASDRFEVNASSYATFAEGRLWVGKFDEHDPGKLYSYDVDDAGNVAAEPSSTHITPKQIQGVVVRDDEFILSQSFGRDNPSTMITQPRGLGPLGHAFTDQHGLPNMSEGMAEVDGDIVTLFESGAGEYVDGDDPRARMTRTSLAEVTGDGAGYEVDPAALGDAAGVLDGCAAAIEQAAGQVSRVQVPAQLLGQVAAADPFSSAVTRVLTESGNNLRACARSVGDTADGLVDAAADYRRAEEAIAGVLDKLDPF